MADHINIFGTSDFCASSSDGSPWTDPPAPSGQAALSCNDWIRSRVAAGESPVGQFNHPWAGVLREDHLASSPSDRSSGLLRLMEVGGGPVEPMTSRCGYPLGCVGRERYYETPCRRLARCPQHRGG